ncbi:hypothetical protein DFH07DRAFT_970021 [Mycena maculata]|uniref:Uncharacterized protein n=1 Tax=Mycena maculata TaxID=230809 RepID=A0AAD7MQQ0_9AGAR|nr:hypothetical protein DFH07DRAFT_970021 [Mycena maculata]
MQFPLVPRVNPFLGIPRVQDRNGALVTIPEYLAQISNPITYSAAANIEQAELRLEFETRYPYAPPHPDRHAETPSFRQDRALLEARLACSRAIWYLRDYYRMYNNRLLAIAARNEAAAAAAAILAASAAIFDDAVSDLRTDEYLAAWHACPSWQVRSWGIAAAPLASTAISAPLPNTSFPGVWGTGTGTGWGTGHAWLNANGNPWGPGTGWADVVPFGPRHPQSRRLRRVGRKRIGAFFRDPPIASRQSLSRLRSMYLQCLARLHYHAVL